MKDMTKGISAAALIAALALAPAAFAQSETPVEEAPATEAAPADAAPATDSESEAAPAADPAADLSMGEEVPDPSKVGTTYKVADHGDWELRCVVSPDGNDPCNLYQLLKDDNGNDVAEISLFRLPEGGQAEAGATIITPLETLLTEQVTLAIDGGAAKRYPFTFCGQIGCFSRIGLTGADVAAFKAGNKVTMSIAPMAAPDQKVALNISLAGFTAGYKAVSETNQPKPAE